MAKAEAEADLIMAETQIELSDMQRRAVRLGNEEARKQKNIEDIIRRALPDLKEDAEPHKLKDDWLVYFFDRCRLVSETRRCKDSGLACWPVKQTLRAHFRNGP